MKKFLCLFLIIFLTSVSVVHAQNRGVLQNTWASWYTVTTASQTITFPYPTRDFLVMNGSSSAICVSAKGGTITSDCLSTSSNAQQVFQLGAGLSVSFSDYRTDSISLKTLSSTASPVTVIVAY